MRSAIFFASVVLIATSAVAQPCKPLETREANVPEQKPAFAGQTRACEQPSEADFDVSVLAKGL
jgi:aldose sugar dehydrogenase